MTEWLVWVGSELIVARQVSDSGEPLVIAVNGSAFDVETLETRAQHE